MINDLDECIRVLVDHDTSAGAVIHSMGNINFFVHYNHQTLSYIQHVLCPLTNLVQRDHIKLNTQHESARLTSQKRSKVFCGGT